MRNEKGREEGKSVRKRERERERERELRERKQVMKEERARTLFLWLPGIRENEKDSGHFDEIDREDFFLAFWIKERERNGREAKRERERDFIDLHHRRGRSLSCNSYLKEDLSLPSLFF